MDLAHQAVTAGAARDTMFQAVSGSSNVGPGSGGAPTEPPGASAVAGAWTALYDRLLTGLKESAENLEYLGRSMILTAQSMQGAEDDAELELKELLELLDGNY